MKALLPLACIVTFSLSSCLKDEDPDPRETLEDYLCLFTELERSTLIACAGGNSSGLDNSGIESTDVFFYPEPGATNFKYYEAESVSDSTNYEAYKLIDLPSEMVFNGYMRKIELPPFEGEKMAIVTYQTPGKQHVCDPIRLKTNTKPTEVNSELVTVSQNGVTPAFSWLEGVIEENVIFFQVVSDSEDDLISGTYTLETNFTFYDLNNVVLNVSPVNPEPELIPNANYDFTLMGVSEDNWINMFSVVDFSTAE
ncbi:MAG: hypothetical protein AB8B53_12130 [Flavobacteriales bacterium]